MTGIAVLTITDSLLFRLKNVVYWSLQSLMKMRSERQTIYYILSHTFSILSLLPYPSNTITRQHIPLKTSCLTATSLAFSNTIHGPVLPYVQKYSPAIDFRAPSKQEVRHSPLRLELSQRNNPKIPHTRKAENIYRWIYRALTNIIGGSKISRNGGIVGTGVSSGNKRITTFCPLCIMISSFLFLQMIRKSHQANSRSHLLTNPNKPIHHTRREILIKREKSRNRKCRCKLISLDFCFIFSLLWAFFQTFQLTSPGILQSSFPVWSVLENHVHKVEVLF